MPENIRKRADVFNNAMAFQLTLKHKKGSFTTYGAVSL